MRIIFLYLCGIAIRNKNKARKLKNSPKAFTLLRRFTSCVLVRKRRFCLKLSACRVFNMTFSDTEFVRTPLMSQGCQKALVN